MSRKHSVKEVKDFNNKVRELLNEYGAARNNDHFMFGEAYKIDTELGAFHLRLDGEEATEVYTVFGAFEDTNELTGRFNSKYNFHEFNKEKILNEITWFLARYAWEIEKAF